MRARADAGIFIAAPVDEVMLAFGAGTGVAAPGAARGFCGSFLLRANSTMIAAAITNTARMATFDFM